MPSIITDTFDYNDIIRVLDLDEAFVHHQVDDLQPKYFRVMQKAKTKVKAKLQKNRKRKVIRIVTR